MTTVPRCTRAIPVSRGSTLRCPPTLRRGVNLVEAT